MKRLLLLYSLFFFSAVGVVHAGQHSIEAGKLLLQKGEHVQAYSQFFQLFQKNPQDVDLNFYLGQAAYGMGDYEAAVMAFERVLIIDPDSSKGKAELGKSYYRLGSIEIALQYLEDALDDNLPAETKKKIRVLLEQIKSER